jgi:hypothetical protein
VIALQRSVGNHAVARLLARPRRTLARLQTAAAFHAAASGGGAFDQSLDSVETQLEMCHVNEEGLAQLRTSAVVADQQTYADRRMADLDALEKLIYAWLRPRDGHPPRQGAPLTAANALLDDVQATHRQFVNGYVHARNLQLWAADAPSGAARATLNADWDALRNAQPNAGHVRVTEQARPGAGAPAQQIPGFADEMRAMHARLLSRPSGRQLLHDLLNGPHNPEVSVEPYNPAVVALFEGMAGAEANADARAQALVHGGSTMTHPVANVGSSTTMAVQSGLRDSQEHNVDSQNRPISAPAYILYAHELVHAHHNMQGRNRASIGSPRYDNGGDLYAWENAEEHAAIATEFEPISENSIRAEHGLPARFGHRS